MSWRNARVPGALGSRQPERRDAVRIDGSATLQLAAAVVQSTTVGTLTVSGDDGECIGYVCCIENERSGRAYRGRPWAGLGGVVAGSPPLADEAPIADALRLLRSEGKTRAVVIHGSGHRLAVLSTAPIGPATDVARHEDFATEWDARLG